MHNPFDLNDAVIRDLPHVKVTRQAAEAGSRCTYRKQFKADGLRGADYWLRRENEFLLDFAAEGLKHVVELSELKRVGDGRHTPLVSLLATFDAGVTVEDWLKLRPRYANGNVYSHPFFHAGQFLLLVRACLVALREIHALGIVHCDIKADNICIPHTPYPFEPRPGLELRIDYEQIRLIDFAFSLTPKRPLQQPLPILPVAPYQSNLLKTALNKDQSGGRKRLATQDVDFRADLYSLGHMAEGIAQAGLLPPAGSAGYIAYDGARSLPERLRAFELGKRPKPLPHDGLIAEIDGWLEKLGDLDAYRRFAIFAIADLAVESTVGARPLMLMPTPTVTPMAEPVSAKTPLFEDESCAAASNKPTPSSSQVPLGNPAWEALLPEPQPQKAELPKPRLQAEAEGREKTIITSMPLVPPMSILKTEPISNKHPKYDPQQQLVSERQWHSLKQAIRDVIIGVVAILKVAPHKIAEALTSLALLILASIGFALKLLLKLLKLPPQLWLVVLLAYCVNTYVLPWYKNYSNTVKREATTKPKEKSKIKTKNAESNHDYRMADWGNNIRAIATYEDCSDPRLVNMGYKHNILVDIPIERVKNLSQSWFTENGRAVTIKGCWYALRDGFAHARMIRKQDGKLMEKDLNFNDGNWQIFDSVTAPNEQAQTDVSEQEQDAPSSLLKGEITEIQPLSNLLSLRNDDHRIRLYGITPIAAEQISRIMGFKNETDFAAAECLQVSGELYKCEVPAKETGNRQDLSRLIVKIGAAMPTEGYPSEFAKADAELGKLSNEEIHRTMP